MNTGLSGTVFPEKAVDVEELRMSPGRYRKGTYSTLLMDWEQLAARWDRMRGRKRKYNGREGR